MDNSEPQVKRLSAGLERDFYTLHEQPEISWCFCAAWAVPTWDGWVERTAGENRAVREGLFRTGRHDGYLLYAGAAPVGWCQCAPLAWLPKLRAALSSLLAAPAASGRAEGRRRERPMAPGTAQVGSGAESGTVPDPGPESASSPALDPASAPALDPALDLALDPALDPALAPARLPVVQDTAPPADDDFGIGCFVLRPDVRGRGYASSLLRGLLGDLERRMARRVWAMARSGRRDDGEVWTGPASLYEATAFRCVAESGDRRLFLKEWPPASR